MSSVIFREKRILRSDYIPREIPHRGDHLDRLRGSLRGGEGNLLALLIGGKGTGKTLVCRRLLDDEEESARVTCYVDCREDRTPGDICRSLYSTVRPYEPLRGHSTESLFLRAMQAISEENGGVIVLDHMDITLTTHPASAFLFGRTEAWPTSDNAILIAIALESPETLMALDARAASTLRGNMIDFGPYSEEEVGTILRHRVGDAFRRGAVSSEGVDMCVEKAVDHHGNVQYALDLLLDAGERATKRRSLVVEIDDLKQSEERLPSAFSLYEMDFLNEHERLVLIALTQQLWNNEDLVTTGELEEQYRELCERLDLSPVGHTTLWKSLKALDTLGFVTTSTSGKGFRGRTTLIRPNFPSSKALRQRLMSLH